MRKLCVRIGGAVLLLAMVACNARERAGVSLDNLPELALQGDLRIGEMSRENYTLARVLRLIVGSDGTVYLTQLRDGSVRMYSAAGEFIRNIGRSGQGPGEFGSIDTMGFRGDTLWVIDRGNARIGLYTPQGDMIQEFTFRIQSPGSEQVSGAPVSLLEDGSVLVSFQRGRVDFEQYPKPQEIANAWYRATRGAVLGDSVLRLEYPHLGVIFEMQRGGPASRTFMTEPFSDTPLALIPNDGSALVIVRRQAATASDSAVIVIERVNPLTGVATAQSYSYVPMALSQQQVDSALRAHFAGDPLDPDLQHNMQSLRTRAFIPRFLPHIDRAVAGLDGSTWIRKWGSTTWLVVDARGAPAGSVRLPVGFQLFQADIGHIWGYEESADGVPQVVRYRISLPQR